MRDIPGYEGKYAITSCGKVYSYRTKKFLKNCLNPRTGYYQVSIYDKDGKLYVKPVHRLVALTYIANPESLPQINHKDEDKSNNCIQNLAWCDAKYNCNYGTRNSRISQSRLNYFKGV